MEKGRLSGESSRRFPRISHLSHSTIGSDFFGYGSSPDHATYTIYVPPTPDNNPATPAMLQICRNELDHGSSSKDDESVLNDPNIGKEEEEDKEKEKEGEGEEEENSTLLNKSSTPLTRLVKISPIIIALYRILIVVRILALALFLTWRVRNPNNKAIWLWLLSVICELWFAFSWLLDQIPKLFPVNHATDTEALKVEFESITKKNPKGISDLPGIDVFVSTADPEKEPPLVTANTILSILSVDYPLQKLSCYVSDDGGSLLTFEAMAEAASFAKMWVPFCRKHEIEPRNPESYFGLKRDPYKDKVRHDFVRDRRHVKRAYDEFKVRVNALPHSIRTRSDAFNSKEEIKALEKWKTWKVKSDEEQDKELKPNLVAPKVTWMSDGTHWPGTWNVPCQNHSRGDHGSIIQVLLDPPGDVPVYGKGSEGQTIDLEGVDTRLPMLVYVSREKRPGYEHNKKAGAMNALVRASAIMSNGPFIMNLDCDHYVYNSRACRDGICFMMDRGGDRVCYVQFPQRFEGIDPSDRYANKNTVFFDINLRALDGIQGPMYVGTGCLFRRTALYGFDPPLLLVEEEPSGCGGCCFTRTKKHSAVASVPEFLMDVEDEDAVDLPLIQKQFGSSSLLVNSVKVAEFQGRPLAKGHLSRRRGRPPGSLTGTREPLDFATVSEAVNVISCWYEDKTEWGINVGWIYGSVTEDVVTGFRMHEKGWRSYYCVTEPDAFRGSAPINLTDRLHQVLRWATGSVEIFFSRNNAILAGRNLKFLQRISYLNVGIYPFTSIFILTYCFIPPLSLFSGQFVVDSLKPAFLVYLLVISLSLCGLAVLEVKWSGITLEEWWRNEQFWLIGGTSAHLAAVVQGVLKVIAGIEISFTLTSKSSGDEEDDDFADLYLFKWTFLMIPPLTIIILNIVGILFAVCRTVFTDNPQWSNLVGGTFFAVWVLVHMYPFAKGLMGRTGKTPTIVYVWSGLLAICFSLLYVTIKNSQLGSDFEFT